MNESYYFWVIGPGFLNQVPTVPASGGRVRATGTAKGTIGNVDLVSISDNVTGNWHTNALPRHRTQPHALNYTCDLIAATFRLLTVTVGLGFHSQP